MRGSPYVGGVEGCVSQCVSPAGGARDFELFSLELALDICVLKDA